MRGNGSPGTAVLHEMLQDLCEGRTSENARRRAMLLSWVDEAEREMGYGEPGQPLRTSQIRHLWHERGEA